MKKKRFKNFEPYMVLILIPAYSAKAFMVPYLLIIRSLTFSSIVILNHLQALLIIFEGL